MRYLIFRAAIPLLFATPLHPPTSTATAPQVQVSGGTLRGLYMGNLVVFRGIPFAAPPVGNLRWREPQPASTWPGVRDATKFSHPCMQSVEGTDNFVAPLAETYGASLTREDVDPSEDCLYLNVWTPRPLAAARLPVMVWLHGGSNRVGSGAESGYDGSALAARGVIVVTINYRLGAMGFLTHPELSAESPHHSSGNYGLLDQIAALWWVRSNIAAMGGDPGNVTLFGESAGSVDDTTLMASPLAGGLFRRVIGASGPAFGLGPSRTVAQMEPLGVAIGKQAGAQAGSQLATLRALPAAQVTKIENDLVASRFKGYDPNASVVDGWMLPQSPAKAFASGKILAVDLLAGLNAREFSAFRIAAAANAKKASQPATKPGFSDQVKVFTDTARPLYGNWTDMAVAGYVAKILVHGAPAVDQASNDIVAACPIGAEAALTTSAGRRAWVYRFDRSVPGKGQAELGAFHSLEIPYVFGTFKARTFNWLPFGTTDYKLSNIIQTYWTDFAKTGDPNGSGLPDWSAWNSSQEPYLSFSQGGDAVPQHNFSPNYCHLAPDRLKTQLLN